MEKYIWSLDISTTNIGFALWDDKGKLIELKHLELKTGKDVPVDERDIHKAEIFRKFVANYKEHILNDLNGELMHIIVEEPLGGSNNPTTNSLLHGFNGICRYILFVMFGIYPIKINAINTGVLSDNTTTSFDAVVQTHYSSGVFEYVLIPGLDWLAIITIILIASAFILKQKL